MPPPVYIAIDLKSFYASVECVERNLDPLTNNLVVADASRTEKTICLAVSPSLKAYGIPGRPRLFEVIQKVAAINIQRQQKAPLHTFTGSSFNALELQTSPQLALAYITAPPRMACYLSYSTKIYNIYLQYIAPEDIHVYSIDEVFIDATPYLNTYKLSARQLAIRMIRSVLQTTGITATVGIGTNLYLCKIAMDIVAKHAAADKDGVRIAELDEYSYRKLLWAHRPITDFWRIGSGYARKLAENGLYTMGDIARCSLGQPSSYYNEELLYKLFGINAELLIDHAWGWEPCTMADIKAYRPSTNSLCSGQVLHQPYTFAKARLITREMTELLVLDLVSKRLVTNQLVLVIGYDIANLKDSQRRRDYQGPITTDHYGRPVPVHARGTTNLKEHTSSTQIIVAAALALYDKIVDRQLLIRRVTLTANHVLDEASARRKAFYEQLDLFGCLTPCAETTNCAGNTNCTKNTNCAGETDCAENTSCAGNTNCTKSTSCAGEADCAENSTSPRPLTTPPPQKGSKKATPPPKTVLHNTTIFQKEHQLQLAILAIQKKFGKNSILKGLNLEEGAMTKERNLQIGGHKSMMIQQKYSQEAVPLNAIQPAPQTGSHNYQLKTALPAAAALTEHRYDDLLYCSRPLSLAHPKMSRLNRAAQFAPFAALTGYSESIQAAIHLNESAFAAKDAFGASPGA